MEYFGANPTAAWDEIADYEERLQTILLDYLGSNPRVTIYGEPSASKQLRVPVVSFTVDGMKSQELVERVEKCSSFGFRSGHMYSYRLLEEVLGLKDVEDGVVRVSLLHYNTGEFPVAVAVCIRC